MSTEDPRSGSRAWRSSSSWPCSLGLAVALYNKAFTEVARVTLETDTAGNELQQAADVKVRGVIVGDVRDVEASAEGATIELAIDPDDLDHIPANVTARLLPKTLFGERYVALVLPEAARAGAAGRRRRHRPGPQRQRNRAQQVLDDLLPLLQAVPPQDLAHTLGAVADAVRGRGDDLGANLPTGTLLRRDQHRSCRTCRQDISLLATSPTPTTRAPTT